MRWEEKGGIWEARLLQGFLTLRVAASRDAFVCYVNGREILLYPATVEEAQALAVRGALQMWEKVRPMLESEAGRSRNAVAQPGHASRGACGAARGTQADSGG